MRSLFLGWIRSNPSDRSNSQHLDSSFEQTFLPMKRKPVSDLYTVSNSFPSFEFFLATWFTFSKLRGESLKIRRNFAAWKLGTKRKGIKGAIKEGIWRWLSYYVCLVLLFFGGKITFIESIRFPLLPIFHGQRMDKPYLYKITRRLFTNVRNNNRASWRIQSELVFYHFEISNHHLCPIFSFIIGID